MPPQGLQVDSEIGALRRVLVHRPGHEIDWMVPSMMERLLFDDILYGKEAREEHDAFRAVLNSAGVETLDPEILLTEVVADSEHRSALLDGLGRRRLLSDAVIGQLDDLSPARLASALIAGVRATGGGRGDGMAAFYQLPPIPNYFFQRDPQAVLGSHVLVSAMATEAREREPLLSRAVFAHHPAINAADRLLNLPTGNGLLRPMIEGGDVLVASAETLLVGLSERTNRWGIEALARALRQAETSFRRIVVVELPAQRSYMHLDTVFTFIDDGLCLAYLPVIAPDGAERGHVYTIDLEVPEISYTLCDDLPRALADLGQEIELVACGGEDSLIDQQREQWTDGANAFVIAPGVIVIYQRNRRTTETLAKRGWRVLFETDVIEGGARVLGEGPTVVLLSGNELSRARGGPRCMTMPLNRDPL